MGCEEVEEKNTVKSLNPETASENATQRQPISIDPEDINPDLSCLQKCGQEARGTVYANCLDEGGEREECATSGRQWYRECLSTRCGEVAIQRDDCMTGCRIDAKTDHEQCTAESDNPKECRAKKRVQVDECIAECGEK